VRPWLAGLSSGFASTAVAGFGLRDNDGRRREKEVAGRPAPARISAHLSARERCSGRDRPLFFSTLGACLDHRLSCSPKPDGASLQLLQNAVKVPVREAFQANERLVSGFNRVNQFI